MTVLTMAMMRNMIAIPIMASVVSTSSSYEISQSTTQLNITMKTIERKKGKKKISALCENIDGIIFSPLR